MKGARKIRSSRGPGNEASSNTLSFRHKSASAVAFVTSCEPEMNRRDFAKAALTRAVVLLTQDIVKRE